MDVARLRQGARHCEAAYQYELRFDGGSRRPRGQVIGGAGAVVLSGGHFVWAAWKALPGATSNIAEWTGLLMGLRHLVTLSDR